MISKIRESLSPLNVILCFSGCPLFPFKNKVINIIIQIHCLILITSYPVIFLFNRHGINSDVPFVIKSTMFVWKSLSISCSILLLITIFKMRHKWVRTFESMQLTEHDYKRISQFTRRLIITAACYAIFIKIFILFAFMIKTSRNESVSFYLNSPFFVLTNYHYWYLIPIVLYLTMLQAIDLNDTNVMKECKRNLEEPVQVCRVLNRLHVMKKKFSDSISFLILCLYFRLFLAAVGSICRANLFYGDDKIPLIARVFSSCSVVRVSVEICLLIYMTFKVDRYSKNSKKRLESLARFIIQTKDPNEWSFVLIRIKESKQFEYNAFNTFVINRNSLLSFATSFVSLTVLFVQLINQQYQPQSNVAFIGFRG